MPPSQGISGTSLAVQWLRLHASTAGGVGLIPGWGTKIPHAMWRKKKKKKSEHQCLNSAVVGPRPIPAPCSVAEYRRKPGLTLPPTSGLGLVEEQP